MLEYFLPYGASHWRFLNELATWRGADKTRPDLEGSPGAARRSALRTSYIKTVVVDLRSFTVSDTG